MDKPSWSVLVAVGHNVVAVDHHDVYAPNERASVDFRADADRGIAPIPNGTMSMQLSRGNSHACARPVGGSCGRKLHDLL